MAASSRRNNRDRNFIHAKLQRRMEEIESSIQRCLTALDTADRQEPTAAQAQTERLQVKIAALKARLKELQEIEVQLRASPDRQISLTDPDVTPCCSGSAQFEPAGRGNT
jgi:transposase